MQQMLPSKEINVYKKDKSRILEGISCCVFCCKRQKTVSKRFQICTRNVNHYSTQWVLTLSMCEYCPEKFDFCTVCCSPPSWSV